MKMKAIDRMKIIQQHKADRNIYKEEHKVKNHDNFKEIKIANGLKKLICRNDFTRN